MTLEQLGEQYLSQADSLRESIKRLSEQKNELFGMELYELNCTLTALREMERDTRSVGKRLSEYYSGNICKKHYHSHCGN